ncbi:MAG TPA: IS110 family transposase [Syntrophales bacterium]|nr:IS110 family transposase [Syntrophales bacterium]
MIPFGHCKLYEILSRFLQKHPDGMLFAAVESTGGYENNWLHTLMRFQALLNMKAARLNPFGVNANSKASLRRVITDKISARDVAEYMISHPERVSYQQEDYWESLRKLWGFFNMLTKQKTQLLNQLESLLYSANPELMAYCKKKVSLWLLEVLRCYPTAQKLSEATPESLARIPYVSAFRAQELIDKAKRSVASASDGITEELIVDTVEQIIQLKAVIQAQEKKMSALCSLPEVALLMTFQGIGIVSAIGLMIEIQALERFASVKKLASFFGLHPVFKTSGDNIGGYHMSKQGRKKPRRILFMITMAAISKNPHIRGIYEEHTKKGMKGMVAVGLCMHKILRVIYGMLKHNQPYNPEIDVDNRTKMVQKQMAIVKDKNRRYQDFDNKAPISRRQYKTRMECKMSHSDNFTKCGIIVSAPSRS